MRRGAEKTSAAAWLVGRGSSIACVTLARRPTSNVRTAHRPSKALTHFVGHGCALVAVDLHDSAQQLRVAARVGADLGQRAHVLGETAAAVAQSRAQEMLADAVIVPHAAGDLAHVCSHALADARDLIDEADA